MLFFTIASCSIGFIAIHEIFRIYYPNQYNVWLIFAGFQAISVFTKAQSYFNRFSKQTDTVYKPLKTVFQYLVPRKDLFYIKDGSVIYETSSHAVEINAPRYYDFIIYETITDKKTHRALYKSYPNEFQYEVSKVQFIMIEIIIQNSDGQALTKKLQLSTPSYNYYICNNELDHGFIMYYLNRYHNYKILFDDEYEVKIMDQDVNMFTLKKGEKIIFEKTSYKIVDEAE